MSVLTFLALLIYSVAILKVSECFWFDSVTRKLLACTISPFGRVSRSRELLTCTLFSFWTGFAFARCSRVRVFFLLDGFRVRENFSRARFLPFGRVSRSRGVLACAFSSFWAGFAFARTSHVHVILLLDEFRVRENFSRARFLPFRRVSRSRGVLARLF
jgi:hypothetical protein